uniref:Conserved oligomeric Golgi complex subunit 3 n=1 Tax=Gongylonema pulchrum TaxID=637853 RepID=A0A183EV02_9BILA
LTVCCQSLEDAARQIRDNVSEKYSRSRRCATSDTIPQRDYVLDFSKYKSSASEFFHDPRRWFQLTSNNAFLELLLQIPLAVMETTSDSRRVIDVQLKTHCHSVINTASDMIIMELAEYISKAENATAAADFDLAKSEALKPETMQNFAGQAYKKLTRLWPEIKKCFDLYIGVKETEEILLQPIKKKIIDVSSFTVYIFLLLKTVTLGFLY